MTIDTSPGAISGATSKNLEQLLAVVWRELDAAAAVRRDDAEAAALGAPPALPVL